MLVYDGDVRRARPPHRPTPGKALLAEWVEAHDGRARLRGVPRRLPGHRDGRRGDRPFLGHDRGGAGERHAAAATISPSPAPTTASGTPSRSSACAIRTCSRLLRQRDRRPGERGLARPGLPDHVAAQRGEPRRRGAVRRTATTISASRPRRRSSVIPPMSIASRRSLTLQGAVAHCDMPVESGPTLYLPYSQTYVPGYLATGRPEFRAYFDRHHVQLPSPRAMRPSSTRRCSTPPGTNRSADVRRMANLLQVSSAYGRAMESVDRTRMSAALYPALRVHARGRAAHGRARPPTPSRPAPRAIPSRPISTATRRSAGWRRRPSRRSCARRLAEGWEPEAFERRSRTRAWRRLT